MIDALLSITYEFYYAPTYSHVLCIVLCSIILALPYIDSNGECLCNSSGRLLLLIFKRRIIITGHIFDKVSYKFFIADSIESLCCQLTKILYKRNG